MKSIIKSAKTIEEAVQSGLSELGLERDKVEIEIIEEPTKGIFGIFGGNDAVVKIKEKENSSINLEEIFGDLKSDDDEEETIEEVEEEFEFDSNLEERFNKYDIDDEILVEETEEENHLVEEKEELDEETHEVEENDYTEEEYSFSSEELDTEVVLEEDHEDEDISDFYEDGVSFEDLEENDDYEDEDFEEDNKEYEVFKSDESLTINTRDLEFSNSVDLIEDGDSLSQAADKVKKILENILVKMHIEAKVDYETSRDNVINLNLSDISENDTGIVIGSKGETLNAIQYTLSLLTNRNTTKFYRVTVNVADYRDRRKKSIESNAKKVAFKVLKTKKSIALKPMNSYERRIVHYALQNYKEIETVSSGKFPNRKVVVKYKG